MKNQTCTQPVGRPRSFDTDTALKCALQVFWEKGYAATSLNDLTEAMGINKPSLYAAYGNKEQLFIKTMELYDTRPDSYFYSALEKSTLLGMVEHMLMGAAEQMSDKTQPHGCMLIQSTFASKEPTDLIKEAVTEKRQRMRNLVLERLEQAKKAGEIAANANCSTLVDYMFTIVMGMSLHASNGATRQQLEGVAQLSLLTFKSLNNEAQ